MPEGVIVKALSGFYYVRGPEGGSTECRARGKFRLDGDNPLVGDRVVFSADSRGQGRVEKILERKNCFVRPAVANIDVMVVIASESNPVTDPFLIDRVTASAENKGCRIIICINKKDLSECGRLADIYARTPYEVITTSTVTGEGIDALADSLSGCVCAFSGNSGVGKSSIINALSPELSLLTGEVSDKLGRGRHTTRHVEMFPVGKGAYIVDTPGFASFDFEQTRPIPAGELQYAFPEFAPFIGECRFDDCAHLREPGCAVRAAAEKGVISPSRLESYGRLYAFSKECKEWD